MSRPEALACEPVVREYLGWPVPEAVAVVDGASSNFVQWHPSNAVSAGLIGSDMRQYFAGQRWVACVAYPEFAPFQGSIRGSVRDGRSADSYAACLPVFQGPTGQLVSCAQPHRTEIFGWSTGTAANVDVATSCAELVQRLTRMRDPSAGGVLTVTVLDPNAEGAIGDVTNSTGASGRLGCSVTVAGPRRLVGTLIGIGDRALPWE